MYKFDKEGLAIDLALNLIHTHDFDTEYCQTPAWTPQSKTLKYSRAEARQ